MVPSLYVKTLVNCNGPQYAIRQIFDHARTMAPCLLIFEDLDSLVTDEVRSYFLNEVDGLESNDGILMVGSTNHLEKLDPAITKRPSRFDRKYQFKIPGEEERVLYCQYWRKKVSKSRLVDFPEEAATIIAKLTEGFSFAYLKELFVMTLLSIARGNEAPKPEEQEVSRFINGLTDVSADHGKEEESEANGERGKEVEANDENEIEHPDPHQVKRTIPDIEVLEALQNNVLINVARRNIQILLDDMDNTGADEGTAAKHLSTRQLRQQQPIGARVIGYQQAVPICL